ncbi:SpoIIE family protein phosphatase [Streptomyces sp. NPDC002156]
MGAIGDPTSSWFNGLMDTCLDMSTAVAVTDPDGRVTRWSNGAQRLLGYTPGEIVGRPVADLFASDVGGGGGSVFRHRDGRLLGLEGSVCPLLDGEQVTGFLLIAAAGDGTLMQWAFDQYPKALVIYDRGGRLLRINEEMARAIGHPENEVRGLRLTDYMPGSPYEEGEELISRVAMSGEPEYMDGVVRVPGESRAHAWAVDIFPLKGADGQVRAVTLEAYDDTQQHGSRERLALLSEARTRIGSSLDVEGTAQELADVAVPRFADSVTVDLLDAVFRGELPAPVAPGPVVLRRAAHVSADPQVRETVLATGETHTHPTSSPVARCLTTGRAELHDVADAEIVSRLAEGPMTHSLIAVPIRARDATLGVAVFLRHARTPAPFTHDDLAVTEDLVARVAICLDNARRYTRERGLALTLQRNLLPRGPAQHTGLETAARYRPAGGSAQVGGDWFDVIPLPAARLGLVVGDVVGHGIHASATMGRLRTAVRTLADIDLPPDELLTHLDDIVTHAAHEEESADTSTEIPGDLGATCLYAVYDSVSRTCTMARAGHPAPVVVHPDGTAQVIDLPAGPPLGLGSLPFEATELTMPEGSLLVLFTDGLIEARDQDIDDGYNALLRALTSPAPSLDTLCDTVLETLRPDPHTDDIALLVARTSALAPDHVASWDLPSDPAVVAEARKQAGDRLTSWGLDEEVFTTELVVSELVTNAIRHATGPIRLRLIMDQSLVCEVSDTSGTTPHMRRARLSDEGGRGLLLVAHLTERWGTRHTLSGKTIWAEQLLQPGAGCRRSPAG